MKKRATFLIMAILLATAKSFASEGDFRKSMVQSKLDFVSKCLGKGKIHPDEIGNLKLCGVRVVWDPNEISELRRCFLRRDIIANSESPSFRKRGAVKHEVILRCENNRLISIDIESEGASSYVAEITERLP